MKKFLLIILLLPIGFMAVQAQGLRLNGYVNYTFDDKFDNYYSAESYLQGKIRGGVQYGASLEYMASQELGIEVSYYRLGTQVDINYWKNGAQVDVLDAALNYIMAGGVGYIELNPKIEGYGGIMAGVAIYNNKDKNPEPNEPTSTTKFAWGVKLGGNLWLTERFGLKVQGHLLSAVQAFGGGFYFGTGGVSTGINTYSSFLQFSLGGGLVVKLSGE